METIRQNGKIILHGNDGISIKMIFRNLTGKNFQGKGVCGLYSPHRNQQHGIYVRQHRALQGRWRDRHGNNPECMKCKAENPMKPQLHRIFVYVWQALI